MRSRCAAVALAGAIAVSGCGAAGTYDRLGLSGATIALAGGATTWVGAQYVAPVNAADGRATMAAGSALSIAGLVMCVYALDAILRAESRADFGPTDAEWLREQRRRHRERSDDGR